MSNAISKRLAVLKSYYAEIDAEIARVGMVADYYFALAGRGLDNGSQDAADYWRGEVAQLKADRAEIDLLWNEALLASEAA